MKSTTMTPLKAWMDKKGYTHVQLAQELGYGYDMVYKVATRQDRNVTLAFKIKFIERFGWEEAAHVFDVAPLQASLAVN